MSATSRSSAGVGRAPGRTRRARSRKTATDGTRVGSSVSGVGKRERRQPEGVLRRRARAVRGWSPAPTAAGTRSRSTATVSRAASSRCSQLSTTSSPGRSPRSATQAARTSPWTTSQVQRRASACGIAAGSVTGASSSTIGASLRCATSSATRVLPTPPAPTIVTSRSARQQPVQRRDLRLPADEAGGRAGAARPRPIGSAAGDVAFQLGQRGRRVETGLVGQPSPVLPADPQRLGGLPGRGQRAHQQQHRRFAQRVGGVRRGGERDDVARPARVDGAARSGRRSPRGAAARSPRRRPRSVRRR